MVASFFVSKNAGKSAFQRHSGTSHDKRDSKIMKCLKGAERGVKNDLTRCEEFSEHGRDKFRATPEQKKWREQLLERATGV